MAIRVRTLLKFFAGLLAVQQATSVPSRAQETRPEAAPRAEKPTMAAFIRRLRQDPLLRERFSRHPRDILREQGIDPGPYNLPDQLTKAQLDRLLSDWSRPPAASQNPPAMVPPAVPAVVYGPPPGPVGPPPEPPAPVYGPPPGLRPGGR
jgi:hypothetical protein